MIKILSKENINKLNFEKLKLVEIKENEKGINHSSDGKNMFDENYTILLEERKFIKKIKHEVTVYNYASFEENLNVLIDTDHRTKNLNMFVEKLIKELKMEPKNRFKFLFKEKRVSVTYKGEQYKQGFDFIFYSILNLALLFFLIDSVIISGVLFITSLLLNYFITIIFVNIINELDPTIERNRKRKYLYYKFINYLGSVTVTCMLNALLCFFIK